MITAARKRNDIEEVNKLKDHYRLEKQRLKYLVKSKKEVRGSISRNRRQIERDNQRLLGVSQYDELDHIKARAKSKLDAKKQIQISKERFDKNIHKGISDIKDDFESMNKELENRAIARRARIAKRKAQISKLLAKHNKIKNIKRGAIGTAIVGTGIGAGYYGYNKYKKKKKQ